ncbi:hypothetical protein [uncultured Psychrobacter sp.]|uniref:hypothetical protein n=1 Tax=uncultured Psychrobacter sp. TaxID=259303 RepID=UPI002592C198|nr:hypothetical protein [uncultured Psychrobacter sp.]
MHNRLNFEKRSAIKDFAKDIDSVSNVFEIGSRHSLDLKKLVHFKSNKKDIKYIEFKKLLKEEFNGCELMICIDSLCYLSGSTWEEILGYYIKKSDYSIIINPMWMVGHNSLDFKRYGEEWYLSNVPLNKSESYIKKWFANHNSFDHSTNKFIKDSYGVWQTGITEADLKNKLDSLGCKVIKQYYLGVNNKPWIHNMAYLIKKV